MKKATYSKKYKALLSKHTTIARVDAGIMQEIEKASINHAKGRLGSVPVISFIMVLFLAGYWPSTLTYFFPIAKIWEGQLSITLNIRSILDSRAEIVFTTQFLLVCAVGFPMIILLMNRPSLLWKLFSWQSTFSKRVRLSPKNKSIQSLAILGVNTKSFSFILFTVLFYYFELLIVISLGYSYSERIPEEITRVITFVWIMLPMVFISLLPVILFLFSAAFLLAFLAYRSDDRVSPDVIIVRMLRLIDQIDEVDRKDYVSLKDRKDIADTIYKISRQIRNVYKTDTRTNKAIYWAESKMSKVADSFESLNTLILFPIESKLSSLPSYIIPYLNCFLTNNYKELPQEIHENFDDVVLKKGWFGNTLFGFISLSVYMILPIIIVGILISVFAVKIEPLIQTFLNILYGAWILLGTIYFSERLSPDFRKSLFELLKAILPSR